MLEVRSPLGDAARFDHNGIVLAEAPDFTLTQWAGDERALKKLLGKLPTRVGQVLQHEGHSLFRIGPQQIWALGKPLEATSNCFATPLSSGRTRLLLEGPYARQVLAACALIDFAPASFKPGNFVMTGIHHTPVTIHCISENSFHIYALRTFALNVWEWLCDVAQGLPPDPAPVTTATS